MGENQKAWLVLGVLLAVLAGLGGLVWARSSREFRGTLEFNPDVCGIPEGPPPPVAYVVTATERYPLASPKGSLRAWDCPWRRRLTELDSREVVVRGVWRRRRAMNRTVYWRVQVHDIRASSNP